MLLLLQSSKVQDGWCQSDDDCPVGESVKAGHGRNHPFGSILENKKISLCYWSQECYHSSKVCIFKIHEIPATMKTQRHPLSSRLCLTWGQQLLTHCNPLLHQSLKQRFCLDAACTSIRFLLYLYVKYKIIKMVLEIILNCQTNNQKL